MPVQSREQLKKYFKNGTLAKEEYFVDLIDSTFNKVNDHIESQNNSTLQFKPASGNQLISFFKNENAKQQGNPAFTFQLLQGKNGSDEGLSLAAPNHDTESMKNLVCFKKAKTKTGNIHCKVGINTSNPNADLDVNGSLGMKTRLGKYSDPTINPNEIVADGKWHKLLTKLKGFVAFEIFSAAYSPGEKYALCYAIPMNAFAKNPKIKPFNQVYRNRRSRIQMRWVREGVGVFGLEIRTVREYKDHPIIHNRITQLWN